MKRIAYYGGSFDPLHNAHMAIADKLIENFGLDQFVFLPAFHAPHKKRKKPTSAWHRHSMLCLATNDIKRIKVSQIELETPERPYTIETLTKLNSDLPDVEIFFVMGADSWEEITTWREWELVLTIVNIIVVTRPGHEIGSSHVTDQIRKRIVDLRRKSAPYQFRSSKSIYITNAVNNEISATEIRQQIKKNDPAWRLLVPDEVAKYIEKYDIY